MKKKRFIVFIFAGLIALTFLPLRVRIIDKEAAIKYTVNALLKKKRVLILDWNKIAPMYVPLLNADSIIQKRILLYDNDVGMADDYFEELDMKECPEIIPESLMNFYDEKGIIGFS